MPSVPTAETIHLKAEANYACNRKEKVHYHVHKIPLVDRMLIQLSPFHALKLFLKITFNIILFAPSSLKGQSCDSSVGIALGYGLEDRGSRVRFPAGAGNFSLHHRVQNSSGTHPASYPMGTRDSFPGGKAAGA
jgi:hypothetical protein